MSIQIKIAFPGKKDAYVDILEGMMSGKVDRAKAAALMKEAEESADVMDMGDYAYADGFRKYIEAVAKRDKNQYTDYVIYVLNNAAEFTLNHSGALVFAKGLKMIEKLLPTDMAPTYRKTFTALKKLVDKYIRMKEPHATIEFY